MFCYQGLNCTKPRVCKCLINWSSVVVGSSLEINISMPDSTGAAARRPPPLGVECTFTWVGTAVLCSSGLAAVSPGPGHCGGWGEQHLHKRCSYNFVCTIVCTIRTYLVKNYDTIFGLFNETWSFGGQTGIFPGKVGWWGGVGWIGWEKGGGIGGWRGCQTSSDWIDYFI